MGTASDTVGRPLTVTTATASDVTAVVDPLFREYGEWVAHRLEQDVGITFTDADQAGWTTKQQTTDSDRRRRRGWMDGWQLIDPWGVGWCAVNVIDD